MSGRTKQAHISHCKTMQMAENLRAKNAELQQTQWLIEEYKQIVAQDAKSLNQCKHDFRWATSIALLLGFSIGLMTRGIA
jgi:hypothetical protein